MIAVDSSSMIAFLRGNDGQDVRLVGDGIKNSQLIFPPVVLSELLSDPIISEETRNVLRAIPLHEVQEGYWERAGLLRSRLLKKGLKAKLADVLIAQSCLDNDTCLITRDGDFRHYDQVGLKTLGLG